MSSNLQDLCPAEFMHRMLQAFLQQFSSKRQDLLPCPMRLPERVIKEQQH